MRKIIAILFICISVICTSCSDKTTKKETDNTPKNISAEAKEVNIEKVSDADIQAEMPALHLSFKETVSLEFLRQYNGRTININGYLSMASPADGSFVFLMNLPYQTCPFCIPNTTELANTLEVYPRAGEKFEYTEQAVSMTGTLVTAEDGEPFTDQYGYEFSFKLVDAEYHILTDKDMEAIDGALEAFGEQKANTSNMNEYQRIAKSGIIADIYTMFDYTFFLINWTEYSQPTFTDLDGVTHNGFWMYPADIANYKAQFYPSVDENLYKNLIQNAQGLNKDGLLDDVIKVITETETLSKKAIKAIEEQDWEILEKQYWEEINAEDIKFKMKHGEELLNEYNILWARFCNFINSFEM